MRLFVRISKKLSPKQLVWIIILLIVFTVTLKALYTLYARYTESTEDLARSEQTLEKLTIREAVLEKTLTNLNTDRGREYEIRTRFDVAKPGESVVIIVDEPATTTPPVPVKKTWWQSVRDFFLLE